MILGGRRSTGVYNASRAARGAPALRALVIVIFIGEQRAKIAPARRKRSDRLHPQLDGVGVRDDDERATSTSEAASGAGRLPIDELNSFRHKPLCELPLTNLGPHRRACLPSDRGVYQGPVQTEQGSLHVSPAQQTVPGARQVRLGPTKRRLGLRPRETVDSLFDFLPLVVGKIETEVGHGVFWPHIGQLNHGSLACVLSPPECSY